MFRPPALERRFIGVGDLTEHPTTADSRFNTTYLELEPSQSTSCLNWINLISRETESKQDPRLGIILNLLQSLIEDDIDMNGFKINHNMGFSKKCHLQNKEPNIYRHFPDPSSSKLSKADGYAND